MTDLVAIEKGGCPTKRVAALFFVPKLKNRTSKSTVFVVKFIYATK